MNFAVTGATGRFGQAALKALHQSITGDDHIIALARNQEKANTLFADLAAVEVRPGAYEDEEALVRSLQGVDRLLFISSQPSADMPRQQQHTNVVRAAKRAGIHYLVYTSFPRADQANNFLAEDHRVTEALIKEIGLPHAFARNNWYLENEMTGLKAVLAGAPLVYAAGSSQVGWALERDYAAGAVALLTQMPAQPSLSLQANNILIRIWPKP